VQTKCHAGKSPQAFIFKHFSAGRPAPVVGKLVSPDLISNSDAPRGKGRVLPHPTGAVQLLFFTSKKRPGPKFWKIARIKRKIFFIK